MNNKSLFKKSLGDLKDEFLKVEETNNNCTYAITYNPQSQPDHGLPTGFLDWWGEQEDLFKRLRGCKVRLYAEPSKTGRIHFHGLIKITNRVSFAIHDVPKLKYHGSTVIKLIEQHEEWLAYCLKVQNDFQDWLLSEFHPKILLHHKDVSDSEKTISTL